MIMVKEVIFLEYMEFKMEESEKMQQMMTLLVSNQSNTKNLIMSLAVVLSVK